jgi:hypothetical protein
VRKVNETGKSFTDSGVALIGFRTKDHTTVKSLEKSFLCVKENIFVYNLSKKIFEEKYDDIKLLVNEISDESINIADLRNIFRKVKQYKDLCNIEFDQVIETEEAFKFLRKCISDNIKIKVKSIHSDKLDKVEKSISGYIASQNREIDLKGYELPYSSLKFIPSTPELDDTKKNDGYYVEDHGDNIKTLYIIINQDINQNTYYSKIHKNLKKYIIDDIEFTIKIKYAQVLLKVLLIDRVKRFVKETLIIENTTEQDKQAVEECVSIKLRYSIDNKMKIFDFEDVKSVRDIIKNEIKNYIFVKIEKKKKKS